MEMARRFVLYYAPDDVMSVSENDDFDPLRISALLLQLKQEQGIESEVIDVTRWSGAELERAYESAVIPSVWNRYRIRKVFGTNSSSASFFGRGVPALLVYEGERPVHVFPHEELGEVVTICDYLQQLLGANGGREELAGRMDELRKAIGPISIATSELVREGRHR